MVVGRRAWELITVVVTVGWLFSATAIAAGEESVGASCEERWLGFFADIETQGIEWNPAYASLEGKCDESLRAAILGLVDGQTVYDYTTARQIMFGRIFNENGVTCGVYTSRCVPGTGIPDPAVMNCEHLWPQSMGASGPAKTDLHHIAPADSRVNSRRNNYPFCEVATTVWQEEGSRLGDDAAGARCFEPRDMDKGDIARSMMYFSVRYQKPIDASQEANFRRWSVVDPVSATERERHARRVEAQGNHNVFVEFPGLAALISDF